MKHCKKLFFKIILIIIFLFLSTIIEAQQDIVEDINGLSFGISGGLQYTFSSFQIDWETYAYTGTAYVSDNQDDALGLTYGISTRLRFFDNLGIQLNVKISDKETAGTTYSAAIPNPLKGTEYRYLEWTGNKSFIFQSFSADAIFFLNDSREETIYISVGFLVSNVKYQVLKSFQWEESYSSAPIALINYELIERETSLSGANFTVGYEINLSSDFDLGFRLSYEYLSPLNDLEYYVENLSLNSITFNLFLWWGPL